MLTVRGVCMSKCWRSTYVCSSADRIQAACIRAWACVYIFEFVSTHLRMHVRTWMHVLEWNPTHSIWLKNTCSCTRIAPHTCMTESTHTYLHTYIHTFTFSGLARCGQIRYSFVAHSRRWCPKHSLRKGQYSYVLHCTCMHAVLYVFIAQFLRQFWGKLLSEGVQVM